MRCQKHVLSAEEFKASMKKKGKNTRAPKRIATDALVPVEGNCMPYKVNVNPLSSNEAWHGRRSKTDAYRKYENYLLSVLPPKIDLPMPPYEIRLTLGLSDSRSDWDNPIKSFQDVLQKKYGFNDKLIKRAVVEVEATPKNGEYIIFELLNYKKATN
jgi:Holliday junction resolvase RusA-like endonuclease